MAISITALTSGVSNGGIATAETASVAPTANRLVVLHVWSRASSTANGAPPTDVAGAGLTFTSWVTYSETSVAGYQASLWRAMSASPSSGAITITWANANVDVGWSVFEIDGVPTTGTNGSDAVNSNTASAADLTGTVSDITATLAAFGNANNGTISGAGWSAVAGSPATCTPGTGFTEIHDTGSTNAGVSWAVQTQYRVDNDTSVDGAWSATGGVVRLAAEVIAASAGGRTTKNIRSNPLGVELGMDLWTH